MKLGEHDELEFNVDDSTKQLGVTGAFFVMHFEPERADPGKVSRQLREAVQTIRTDTPGIQHDSVLSGFRDLHTAVGVSNRKHVASPENLIALVLAGRDLPSINPIVDVYNSVSLRTKLALGAHDVSRLQGPISLRFTNGTEQFTPLGAAERKAIGVGEYGYIDEGSSEIICRLETRQCEKTKVSPASQDCFFIVQGNPHTDADYIKAAVAKLQALLVECCGGRQTQKIYWLP